MVDLILGPLFLDEIGKAVIARVAARASTNASRRRDLTAVSAVLDAAEGWGWIERNISHDFNRRRIRERRDPIVLPTDAEDDPGYAAAAADAEMAWGKLDAARARYRALLEQTDA